MSASSLRLTITDIASVESDLLESIKELFEVSQTSDTELMLKMKDSMSNNAKHGNLLVSDISKKISSALKGSIDDEILDLGISTDFIVTLNTTETSPSESTITATIHNLLDSSELGILTVNVNSNASSNVQKMYDAIVDKCKAASYITAVEELYSTKIK